MSTGYKIKEQDALHYLTFQIVNWVDLFTRLVYRDIVIDSLRYCQEKKGFEIYVFVIMSNHVHLLARSNIGKLSDTIREFKSFTAKQMLAAIESEPESRREWMLNIFEFAAKQHKRNEKYQIWTHENHAELIYSNAFIDQKVNYIHNNPVRAAIVERPEDYLYSSARAFAGCSCVIDVAPLYMTIERLPLMRGLK
ncbi:transposase [Paludibacter sp.]|uniref:REP-associated tyrosine transposase n=1 Tax=Paludibacter sp. TaxID=1898105 RepID=UPI001352FCDA|nr:transposase [Paludibacter sp.]MTK53912.1 transposase [Paludibacter sp.]